MRGSERKISKCSLLSWALLSLAIFSSRAFLLTAYKSVWRNNVIIGSNYRIKSQDRCSGSPEARKLICCQIFVCLISSFSLKTSAPALQVFCSWPKAPCGYQNVINRTQAEHPNKLGAYPKLISRKSYF